MPRRCSVARFRGIWMMLCPTLIVSNFYSLLFCFVNAVENGVNHTSHSEYNQFVAEAPTTHSSQLFTR